MTATIAPATAEVVLDAWQAYRRSQRIPFPAHGAGDLMKAQSRLFHYAEPYASGREPMDWADVGAIDDAIDALVASVEWACGPEAAAFVAGDHGEQVAA
jgi:hypothetical protein